MNKPVNICVVASPFESRARAMCDEMGIKPSAERLIEMTMALADKQYRAEVAPLQRLLVNLAAVQPVRTLLHQDGSYTSELLASPSEQALEAQILQAIEDTSRRYGLMLGTAR